MTKSSAHVHILIAKTAQDLARANFDHLCSHSNTAFAGFRAYFPEGTPLARVEEEFVRRMWKHHIDAARDTLVALLSQPLPDVLKNEISEALIQDRSLIRGRRSPTQILSQGVR